MKRIGALVLSLTVLMGCCFTGAFTEPAMAAPKTTIVSAIKNNKSYYIINSYMKSWYKKYKIGSSKQYAKYFEKSHPAGVKLKWKLKGAYGDAELKKIKVYLSTNKKMKKTKVFSVDENSVVVDNLLAGTKYYWYVKGKYRGKNLKSKVYTFKTKWSPRTIRIDGISNVRDIGGYKVPGGRVKQGMIYRSANLDQVISSGKKIALKDLGIKTQLDLRNPATDKYLGNRKPFGSKMKNISLPATAYVKMFENEAEKQILRKEIALFADKKTKYPVLFHCAIGRDRTGTLAFCLNALLGVSKKNLFMDYEMSFFSVSGCYSSSVFTSKYYVNQLTGMYNTINAKYPGKTFKDKTEAFLLDCGVTKAQINAIRNKMIVKDNKTITQTNIASSKQ